MFSQSERQTCLPWMSSVPASPASPPASPESVSPKKTRGGSGPKSRASPKNSARQSASSRTCSDCGRPDCETCWPILPLSGSMLSGRISAHGRSALRISDAASSSLLPTPSACGYGSNQGGSAGRLNRPERPSLETLFRRWLLPTPTVCGDWNRAGASAQSGDGLSTVAGASIALREWMMCLPAGWLEPCGEPLVTRWSPPAHLLSGEPRETR